MSVTPSSRWLFALCLSLAACSGEPPVTPQAEAPAAHQGAHLVALAPPEAEPDGQTMPEEKPVRAPDGDPQMQPAQATPTGDHAKLIGHWVTRDHEPVAHEFRDNKLVVRQGPTDEILMEYTIDSTQSPKHMNIVREFAGETVTFQALYEFRDNRLAICLSKPEFDADGKIKAVTQRPTAIDPAEGLVLLLERVEITPLNMPVARIGLSLPWISSGAMAFSSDNKRAAFKISDRILFWNLGKNAPAGYLKCRASDIAFTRDGKRLVTINSDVTQIWDLASQECIHTWENVKAAGFYPRQVVRLSPDDKMIAVGGTNITARVHNASSGEVLFTLGMADAKCEDLAFNRDGSLLAAILPDSGDIQIWDAQTGQLQTTLKGAGEKRAIAFFPNADRLGVVGKDTPLEIWDVPKRSIQLTIPGSEDLDVIAITKGGGWIAGAAGVGPVKLWEWNGSRARFGRDVPSPIARSSGIGAEVISFSADGRWLGVANGHAARIWPMRVDDALPEGRTYPNMNSGEYLQFETAKRLFAINRAILEAKSYRNQRELENIRDADGREQFSWRVHILQPLELHGVYDRINQRKPWDDPANAAGIERGNLEFNNLERLKGKTRYLRVAGDHAKWREKSSEESPPVIQLVAVEDSAAVLWYEPRDYEWNPETPWNGLSKSGFFAVFTDGKMRWIPENTPDDTLRALFTGEGNVDLDDVTAPAFDRFLFDRELE